MSDKELIKREIERLYAEVNQKPYNGEVEGEMCAYDKLISFIDSLQKKTASEDLEEYAQKLAKGAALDRHNLIWMCKKGAEWQKKKDQEIIELAEDHAMLAGMNRMKEEMMENTVEGNIFREIKSPSNIEFQLRSERFKMEGIKLGDKVKIIIVKEEQQ